MKKTFLAAAAVGVTTDIDGDASRWVEPEREPQSGGCNDTGRVEHVVLDLEEVCAVIEQAMRYVPKDRIFPATNCGMAPMKHEIAFAKLAALSKGAALARERYS